MPICFVIQPFDSGEFDRRFNEVYKPALEQVDLEAYRVDKDPSVEVPIDTIEKKIAESDICFADITDDNPNVWYELGYAFASDLPVVLVCSESREKFPFDIQHRKIITYSSGSPSDFETLKSQISEIAQALLANRELLELINSTERRMTSADSQVTDGLDRNEFKLLAVLANSTAIEGSTLGMHTFSSKMEYVGLKTIEFGLAYRRLVDKGYVEVIEEYDPIDGETYKAVYLTEAGWEWVSKNEHTMINEVKSWDQ